MKTTLLLLCALVFAGCAVYTTVGPGPVAVAGMHMTSDAMWNRATQWQPRPGGEVWTLDGNALNQLIFLPHIAAGETLFTQQRKDQAYPLFQAGMLPNEIMEFELSSLTKYLGEGSFFVAGKNLRPAKFGDDPGILFDVSATGADTPIYRGLLASAVKNHELNVVLYLAATPHYYQAQLRSVKKLLASLRLRSP